MDFTKPVNPAFAQLLSGGTLMAADAIDYYTGSGGGTGFDLAESGFSSIRYIKMEGISPEWAGGEIDACAIVRPAVLGEVLSIAPENLPRGTATLYFQEPSDSNMNALRLTFTALSEAAKVGVRRLDRSNDATLPPGQLVDSLEVSLVPVLGTNTVVFETDACLSMGTLYAGDGANLDVFGWNGTNWTRKAFTFDSSSNAVLIEGLAAAMKLAVATILPPRITMERNGSGMAFTFVPVAGWAHTLERTTGFADWTPVASVTPLDTQQVTLKDPATPVDSAYYRLRLQRP